MAKQAEDELLPYVRLNMPDYTDPSPNPRTRYITGRHHEVLASRLEAVAAGTIQRLIINLGPRHGKTELGSKRFIPWFSGRFSDKSLIFGTYNETFAQDVGRAVRDNIQSPEHRLVFPDHQLKEGSASAQRLETVQGGMLAFVGRGGSITGRGGHGIVIDDPIKDRKEADSRVVRDQLWTWFTQVIATRLMTSDSWIILIQTRWHEDDLVGRITDPRNPFYDPDEAKRWTVIDLPALALDDAPDPLGRAPGEALWPERFPREFLLQQQRLDPRGFQALYQGRPSASGGNFFQVEHLQTYKPDELPKNLRYYAASDHAVSTRQVNDKTALVVVGVDENDNIYVLPDSYWRRSASDVVVDEMIKLMLRYKPLFWWAERGQITRAIGPFLRTRMHERKAYASIIEIHPSTDKLTRAQSIQARAAMGKVFFPQYATWWPEARDQLLKFPNATHDDFVDAMSLIGLGLALQTSASPVRPVNAMGREGTFGHLINQTKRQAAERALRFDTEGW
jgi:predicted phage terminase large subunit-like protein